MNKKTAKKPATKKLHPKGILARSQGPTKKPAQKRLPTNKELGAKPTRKQRTVATKIVEDALQVRMPFMKATPAEPKLPTLPKRNISAYELLGESFERSGRTARLLWSNKFASTYEVTVCGSVSYETFVRVFAEAALGCIRGVNFSAPAREVFPSDRVFGSLAWADMSIERASARYVKTTELAIARYLEKQ